MTTLSYELSKQLELAGWLQPAPNEHQTGVYVFDHIGNRAYSPSLTELIAACGSGFDSLHRFEELFENPTSWGCNFDEYSTDFKTYPSPEEAVARLWLKLQESKT